VRARLTGSKRRYDEGETVAVLEASPDRVQPRCAHFGRCGGCSLQHLDPGRQIAAKQNTLEQNLARIGKVTPARLWPPLTGACWAYRRKARLSVRYVAAKDRVLVGFRETYGRFVADIHECHVLDPRIAKQLAALSGLIHSMRSREAIPQIEVACGDEACALVFRHLEALGDDDLQNCGLCPRQRHCGHAAARRAGKRPSAGARNRRAELPAPRLRARTGLWTVGFRAGQR
jgi:23S rRNA (uracil1939-C5)-methyltransferase